MPAAPDRPARRFERDPAAELGMARLRLAGAWTAALSGVWLVLASDSPGLRLCGVIGVAVATAVGWRGAKSPADGAYFSVGPQGLELHEGGHTQTLSWDEVTGIELDEDRLVVRVTRRQGEQLTVESNYGQVGIYELFEVVAHEARAAGVPAGD